MDTFASFGSCGEKWTQSTGCGSVLTPDYTADELCKSMLVVVLHTCELEFVMLDWTSVVVQL